MGYCPNPLETMLKPCMEKPGDGPRASWGVYGTTFYGYWEPGGGFHLQEKFTFHLQVSILQQFPSSIRTDFLRENHWALLSGPRPEAQANTTKGSIHLPSIKHHNRNTPSSLWGQRVKELLKLTEDCNPLTDKTRVAAPGPLFVIALLCAVASRQDKIPLANCYLKVIRGWEHSTVSKASTRIQDWSPEPCKKAQHTGLCL